VNPGKIIILNGTSSSGKTCLLEALQNLLPEPYLNAGLDKFIWMMPERYLDRPLWDDVLGLANQAGQSGHTLAAGMHRTIAVLARSGSNVLADHVLVEPAWLRDCAELFSELPAYFIGVRCPLEVLEQREKARRNRTLGQARLQYPLVHAHDLYDLEVDTSLLSPQECALAVQARLLDGRPPQAFRQLRQQFNSGA